MEWRRLLPGVAGRASPAHHRRLEYVARPIVPRWQFHRTGTMAPTQEMYGRWHSGQLGFLPLMSRQSSCQRTDAGMTLNCDRLTAGLAGCAMSAGLRELAGRTRHQLRWALAHPAWCVFQRQTVCKRLATRRLSVVEQYDCKPGNAAFAPSALSAPWSQPRGPRCHQQHARYWGLRMASPCAAWTMSCHKAWLHAMGSPQQQPPLFI